MTSLTTTSRGGGLEAVYSGRARVGYIMPSTLKGCWIWEVGLVSEQIRGFPRGFARDRDAAIARCDEVFLRWCEAAGVRRES